MTNLGIMASQISGHLYDRPYGAYDSLATVTLSAATASITFAGIPAGYKNLQIRYMARSSQSGGTSSLKLRFNGDTASNYYAYHEIYGDGSATNAYVGGTAAFIQIDQIPGATRAANVFGTGVIDIVDYGFVNKNKTVRTLAGWDANGVGATIFTSGLWMNSSVGVTSIDLTDYYGANFVQYSSFALYGVK
jgi:hypothetical protein